MRVLAPALILALATSAHAAPDAAKVRLQDRRTTPVAEPEQAPEVTPLQLHRQRMEAAAIPRDGNVGGFARMGVRLGAEDLRARGQVIPEEVEALLAAWDGFGAFVVEVVPGSPAEAAGLFAGDVIVQYAGLWVESYPVLQRLASRSEVGREYEVMFLREGAVQSTWLHPVDASELGGK